MNLIHLIQQNSECSRIAALVAEMGIEAYLVGGFVRDFLLNRSCKDIDVVVVGSGIELAERYARALPHHAEVHIYKNFGTAAVKHQEWDVEFVGARKESYRTESRKPEVEMGTLEDDQKRRDFTINALAISLMPHNLGQLIDPFNGLQHLKQKLIITPLLPETTFSDDPLRMMRAIRFATQLGFDIEADTFQGIIQSANRLEIVSQERIIDELNKIVASNKPSYGFKLLYISGLLNIILPEMVALAGAANQDGHTHKDNFYHTLEVLDNVSRMSDDLWLRWAAILHDIAKPLTKRFSKSEGWTFHGHEERGAKMVPVIFRRLKLPLNEKMKKVQLLVRMHLRPIAVSKETVTDSAIRRILFEAGEHVDDLMKLCRADITTKNPAKAKRYLENFDKVEAKMQEVEAKDKLRNFQPVLTGEMIMKALQIPPGPLVGYFKTEIREAILDGKVKNDLKECIGLLTSLAKFKGVDINQDAIENMLAAQ